MPYYPNELLINQGDGTFAAETDKRGLDGPAAKSALVSPSPILRAIIAGNVYVAMIPAQTSCSSNQGDGTYREQALAFGLWSQSTKDCTKPEMGVAIARL